MCLNLKGGGYLEDEKLEQLQLAAKIELARRNFFEFCHLLMPNFYKRDRKYLVDMCNELQSFVESDDKLLVINLPP